jgi:putative ATP-binding cassette transporter
VFDEWAADQDPTFRRIFYTELLPDLKRLGKTIIVISHDDRYFDMADQLVRMESGRVKSEAIPA